MFSILLSCSLKFEPAGLIKPNLVVRIVAGHVRKDHAIAFLQSVENLNLGHRGAAHFHLDPGGGFALGVVAEEADGAVLVTESRAPHVQHIVEVLEVNGAIHTQLRNRPWRQRPIEGYVNGARSVQYGGINSGNMALDDAVMGVDFGGLAELNVVRLGLGDLQGGFELRGVDDLGNRRSGGDMLTDLHGNGQGTEDAGDAGTDLQFLLLFLIEIQLRPGGVDLGLGRGQLHLNGLLIDVELFGADFELRGKLIEIVLRLLVLDTADLAQRIPLLVDLFLHLGLGVLRVHSGRRGLHAHNGRLQLRVQAFVIGLRALERRLRAHQLLLELRVGHVHENSVRADLGAGQDADACDRGVCLRGNQLNTLFAGGQSAETADVAGEIATFYGVGPDSAGVDGRNGRFETHNR